MAEKMTRVEQKRRTRRRLLEAGVELLLERPVGEVFQQVRAQDVVRAAGVSTGAFYHHWESQADYVFELLEFLTDVERFRAATDVALESVRVAMEQGSPFEEMVRVAADASFWSLADNPYFVVQIGLWSWGIEGDERVQGMLRKLYRLASEPLVALYAEALAGYGLRLRPGTSAEQLATILTAVLEGLVIRYAFDRDAVVVSADEPAGTLFGVAVLELVTAVTEPTGATA